MIIILEWPILDLRMNFLIDDLRLKNKENNR
jgi:hypothetical protein